MRAVLPSIVSARLILSTDNIDNETTHSKETSRETI